MALGWANVIIQEKLYDKEFVEKWCHGFEEYRALVAEWRVERTAQVTGCDPDQIQAAARALCDVSSPRRWGGGNRIRPRRTNAEQGNRAILALIGITGILDVKGRQLLLAFAETGRIRKKWDALTAEQAAKRIGADRFKILNLRPTVYAHPPSVFKAILTGKPYPVKAMLVVGNNPAVTYTNTVEITSALRKLDLLVVSEIFMTRRQRSPTSCFRGEQFGA